MYIYIYICIYNYKNIYMYIYIFFFCVNMYGMEIFVEYTIKAEGRATIFRLHNVIVERTEKASIGIVTFEKRRYIFMRTSMKMHLH